MTRSVAVEKKWFIVIKHTAADWVGVRVDAHYVEKAEEALAITARGPMEPGELLRGVWADNEIDRVAAIKLHDNRKNEDQDWVEFVEQFESAWQRAAK